MMNCRIRSAKFFSRNVSIPLCILQLETCAIKYSATNSCMQVRRWPYNITYALVSTPGARAGAEAAALRWSAMRRASAWMSRICLDVDV